jgi:S-adenosyl-L-methionine hydrolase (adenosine-forming)
LTPSGIITLTTDFGQRDPYVAMMKGVILSINGDARIVDIAHQIAAGAIAEAASILKDAHRFFPTGTVHVAVVDPGVGGPRRPIALVAKNHLFVGPDNGLFWPLIEADGQCHVIRLTDKRYWMKQISATFHGRDIFAPVAAHLSQGVDPLSMGETIDDPMPLEVPLPRMEGTALVGEIVRIDHFGNLITNIAREHLAPFLESKDLTIRIGGLVLNTLSTTYSDVPKGQSLALMGSSNALEIAVNGGNAAHDLGGEFRVGTTVLVDFGNSTTQ